MADKTAGYLIDTSAENILAGHPNHAGQIQGHRLSVIIITKNEAHNIRACLESVSWADEIIVVDSGSTDDTADYCA